MINYISLIYFVVIAYPYHYADAGLANLCW